jgi:hypothetical protein
MSKVRARWSMIHFLITVLAIGAAISGLVILTGMPRIIVQHWEQTSFGTEFLWYLAYFHHGGRGVGNNGDLTLKRMGSGFMELAGALFLWPCHTETTSSRWCECIGSIILLFMFAQEAMVNWTLGLEYEFQVTSVASFMALITLLHGIFSKATSNRTMSGDTNKSKKM